METMGGIIMSDVNEFNVETKQFILRSYTDEELAKEESLNLNMIPDSEKGTPIVYSESQMTSINTLISAGISEEDAKNLIGRL